MHRCITESKTQQKGGGEREKTFLVQAVGCADITLPSPGFLLKTKTVQSFTM